MATNWAKDGLDAYLSLTGEHRAQQRADSEEANRKQMMTLAVNQDNRAATSAGLSNQLAQQGIDKGNKDVEEEAKYRKMYDDMALEKEKENPFTPDATTIKDPKVVASSQYLYSSNKKTAEYARAAVADMGNFSIPFDQIATLAPGHVQVTANAMLGPAAMKRAGQESIDPLNPSAPPGIITGKVGHINLEKGPDGKVYMSGDMEVKNADGTIRYAPFTNRTDNPNVSIKRIPVDALDFEADTTLKGLDEAIRTGQDPNVTIARNKVALAKDLPIEYIKKALEDKRAEDKNLKIKQSYTATTRKADEIILQLPPNATEEQVAKLIAGQSKEVIDHIGTVLGISSKYTEPRQKREDAKTKADADRAERARESDIRSEDRRLLAGGKDGKGPDPNKDMKASEKLVYERTAKNVDLLSKQLENADDSRKETILKEIAAAQKKMKKIEDTVARRNGETVPAEATLPSHGMATVNPFTGQPINTPASPAAKGMVTMPNRDQLAEARLREMMGKPGANTTPGNRFNTILGM